MTTPTTSTQAADTSAPKSEKFAFSIDELCKPDGATPFGRSFIYEEIRAGHLIAQKAGGRTIVTAENLKKYLANLPVVNAASDATA